MTRLFGIAGWSGAGKTTLLARLIPHLVAQGVRVSTVKHAHQGFDLDQPGKDSHIHRMAGATEVLVASARRWALIHELRDRELRETGEPSLAALLSHLAPVDLVLIEGWKRQAMPKLEVFRPSLGKALRQPEDPAIIAVASDVAARDLPVPVTVPVLALDDIAGIAALVLGRAVPLDELPDQPG